MKRHIRWIALLTGLVIDIAVSVAAAFFLVARQDAVAAFFFTLFGLLFAAAAIGVLEFAKRWIGYKLFLKSLMVKEFQSEFRKGEFPRGSHHFDIDSYLSEVIDDEDIAVRTRLRAAFLVGQMNGVEAIRPLTMGLMNSIAAEEALQRHASGS